MRDVAGVLGRERAPGAVLGGHGCAQQFVHVEPTRCRITKVRVEPAQVAERLRATVGVAAHRPVARHEHLQARVVERLQAGGPRADACVGCRRYPVDEDQPTRKGDSAGAIDQHQIAVGVALQFTQFEFATADAQHARLDGRIGQQRFGIAHPVAAQPVEVRFVGARFARHACAGGGGGLAGHVGEGLVAEEVVGVQVEVDDANDRFGGGARDQRTQLIAVAFRRTGVDDHHAGSGGDEAGVDDVAAVALGGEVVVGAIDHVDARREFTRFQAVVESRGIDARCMRRCDGKCGFHSSRWLRHALCQRARCDDESGHQHDRTHRRKRHDPALRGRRRTHSTTLWMRLPLLSVPTMRSPADDMAGKSNENTGFSLTGSKALRRSSSRSAASRTDRRLT